VTTFEGEPRAVFWSSRVHLRVGCADWESEPGCSGSTVKHTANFARERIESEWFLNEIGTRFQFTLTDGGIVGVSRHIEHFDVFPHTEKSFGEVAPAH